MVDSSSYQIVGTTLAGYTLEQLVEAHTWGPIFRARGLQGKQFMLRFVGEPVAREDGQSSSETRIVLLGRIQQEANRIATLRHSSILPLLDYGNFRGTPYLVYPAITPTTLRTLLQKRDVNQGHTTNLEAVGRMLEQIADALAYGHEHAVLHRNLSSQCIYIQANRQLLVGEFGTLRIMELSWPDKQKHLGSSESSAPEQLLGKPIDTSADVYALGAVLYRMLTGHPPFEGRTRDEVVRQHLYASIPPLSTWRNDLPAKLDEVCAKALAKDPAERYAHPETLVQAFYQVVVPGKAIALPRITSSHMAAVKLPPTSKRVQAATAARASAAVRVPAQRNSPSRRKLIGALAGASGLAGVAALMVVTHGFGFLPIQANATTTQTGTGNTGTTKTTPTQQNNQTQPSGGGQQTPTPQPTTAPQQKNVIALKTDVPVNSAKTFAIANQQNPGILVHLPNDKFVAFDSTCTHAGCSVDYNPQNHLLECPCHNASFDPAKDAAVVSRPANRPLTGISIVVNGDGSIVRK